MKVIICTRDLSFGGVGSYVQGLLRELDNNDEVEKVLVIAPEKVEGLSKKIKFDILRSFGKYFITKEPYFAYHCAKKLRKILKKEKFDVIFLRHRLLLFKKLNIPLISIIGVLYKSIHKANVRGVSKATKIASIFDYFYSYFDYKTIQYSDKVVLTCKKRLNEVGDYYPKYKDKFTHIPAQVDISKFYLLSRKDKDKLRKKYKLKKEIKYLLYVGRLDPMKGIELLIETIKDLRKSIDIELLVVGEGMLAKKMESYDFIRYFKKASNTEMYQYYNLADLFVLPSYYENCPIVILEAMACGTLILSSDVGDVRIMLNNDKLIFNVGDKKELSKKVHELLNISTNEKEKITENLMKRVEENYDVKVISQEILKLYEGINV